MWDIIAEMLVDVAAEVVNAFLPGKFKIRQKEKTVSNNMTINEAREFFRQFDGFSFHMAREEPAKYETFQKLSISDSQKDQWRKEIACEYFEKIGPDHKDSWAPFSSMSSVLMSMKRTDSLQEELILKGIEKQLSCDIKTKIITLETICGRSHDYHDGIIAFFKRRGYDSRKLEELSVKLFENELNSEDDRLARAVNTYRSLTAK